MLFDCFNLFCDSQVEMFYGMTRGVYFQKSRKATIVMLNNK